MIFKSLEDNLYSGHVVGSYLDGYFGPATPSPTPKYEDWDDMKQKTWNYFLESNYTWDMLGQPA